MNTGLFLFLHFMQMDVKKKKKYKLSLCRDIIWSMPQSLFPDRDLHSENQFVSGETSASQGGEGSFLGSPRRRVVLLQNSGDDSGGRSCPLPLLQMDLQGRAGGAERRERSASKHPNDKKMNGHHWIPSQLLMSCCFLMFQPWRYLRRTIPCWLRIAKKNWVSKGTCTSKFSCVHHAP